MSSRSGRESRPATASMPSTNLYWVSRASKSTTGRTGSRSYGCGETSALRCFRHCTGVRSRGTRASSTSRVALMLIRHGRTGWPVAGSVVETWPLELATAIVPSASAVNTSCSMRSATWAIRCPYPFFDFLDRTLELVDLVPRLDILVLADDRDHRLGAEARTPRRVPSAPAGTARVWCGKSSGNAHEARTRVKNCATASESPPRNSNSS